jgi:hypothetical protein
MNDFTKQELECLHNATDLQLKKIPMSENNKLRRQELLGKLQSMIDNYCKHRYTKFLVTDNSASFIDKCVKCNDLKFKIQ